jgi:hypothetical protein
LGSVLDLRVIQPCLCKLKVFNHRADLSAASPVRSETGSGEREISSSVLCARAVKFLW